MRSRQPVFRPLVLAGAVLAALVAGAGSPAPVAAAGAPAAPVIETTEGAVLTVDGVAKTFTIHGRKANPTFVWDDATKVVGRKSPAYLKAGSDVIVQYTAVGKALRAIKVSVKLPKHLPEEG